MASLKYQYQPAPGLTPVVTRENSPLEYISLEVLRLESGESFDGNSGDEERALVLITGNATISVAGERYEITDGRRDVFQKRAYTVYVPPATDYQVEATGGAPLEVAIGGAVADRPGKPALITPEMAGYERRGVWNWERTICDLITARNPVSQHLYIIEVLTPPGHWSSVPPHKHDEQNVPYESFAEEIYFYKFKPEQGYGFQRVYTDDRSLDETCLAENNSAVIQPRGYHPVANHPGYQMYYLNVIAGPERMLIPHDDPQHAWLKDVEAVIRARVDPPLQG